MIQRWFSVTCDTEGCTSEHAEKGLTMAQTRQAAVHAGWTRDRGNDICPTHTIRANVSVEHRAD